MKFTFSTILQSLLGLVALVLGFIVLTSVVNLNLAFHIQQPFAMLDFQSFLSEVKIPAGLSNYLGTILTDLWSNSYSGTIITLIVLLLIPIIEYVRFIKKKHLLPFAQAISLAIFALSIFIFADYFVKSSLLFSLIFAYLFGVLTHKLLNWTTSIALQLASVSMIITIVYLSSGCFGLIAYLIFITTAIIFYKTTTLSRLGLIGFILIFTIITPVVFSFFYPVITIPIALKGNLILSKPSIVLYASLMALFLLNNYILSKVVHQHNRNIIWLPTSLSILIILSIWMVPNLRIDPMKKLRIEIDQWAYNKQWANIIKKADKDLMYEKVMAFQINRALYFSGGLLENLFTFPQYLGSTSLLLEKDSDYNVLIPASDIYYDMGYLNESRHWANEAYTRYGKQPRILKRLTQINLIIGNYNGAKKYIELLKKTYSHKEWALEQEQYLFNDVKVRQNAEYSEKLQLLPEHDFFATKSSPQLNLYNLNKNHNNKMAFEYLMANALLEHNLGLVIKYIPEYNELNYESLPKHVQQAVALFMVMTRTETMSLSGYQFSEGLTEKFHNYSQLYLDFNKAVADSKNQLDRNYSNTLWYYIHFVSPNAKHKNI